MCNAQQLPNLCQPSNLPAHVHADPVVAGRRLSTCTYAMVTGPVIFEYGFRTWPSTVSGLANGRQMMTSCEWQGCAIDFSSHAPDCLDAVCVEPWPMGWSSQSETALIKGHPYMANVKLSGPEGTNGHGPQASTRDSLTMAWDMMLWGGAIVQLAHPVWPHVPSMFMAAWDTRLW